MQFTLAAALAFAATLSLAASAAVAPRELAARTCPSQDYQPAGDLCTGDSDCKDPCYPICVCSSYVFSTDPGSQPVSIYSCAKAVKDNVC